MSAPDEDKDAAGRAPGGEEAAGKGGTDPASAGQPDADASSDGDRSWTADPVTQQPDADRSAQAAIDREQGDDRPD